MTLAERAALAALHRVDPETAHGLAIRALQAGLGPKAAPFSTERLTTDLAGLALPNPVGLAAGFDKNATATGPLARCGFGFLEIGAVTPRPQPGNPKPRLFRLTEDQAAINRFGFNNDGVEAVVARLARRDRTSAVLGINLGANKDSEDRAADFAHVLTRSAPHVDFATVNVSSPNTERLRDLQGKDALLALLERVMKAHAALTTPVPVFLKIAPDLTLEQMDDIADVAIRSGISGIFATNTTLSRDGLRSAHKDESGGLSGAPLMATSTKILREMAIRVGGQMPLVGIGGIATAEDALAKIKAGASAVQLYTGLVYGGISLADRIVRDLDSLLAAHGYARLADAVGADL